jgi:hypothetical protein
MELEPLQDKVLICADCGEEFVFTVDAQEYFLQKGFMEEPKRCKTCYTQRKKQKREQQKVSKRKGHRHDRPPNHVAAARFGSEENRGNLK